jgi:hypothetical protein
VSLKSIKRVQKLSKKCTETVQKRPKCHKKGLIVSRKLEFSGNYHQIRFWSLLRNFPKELGFLQQIIGGLGKRIEAVKSDWSREWCLLREDFRVEWLVLGDSVAWNSRGIEEVEAGGGVGTWGQVLIWKRGWRKEEG